VTTDPFDDPVLAMDLSPSKDGETGITRHSLHDVVEVANVVIIEG